MIVKSLEHLKLISNIIADKISKQDCIFLTGEIGVGKTTFVRYLINYLQKREGVKETEVLSPTFNLLYEYDIKNFKVMHYDLYRVKNSKELDYLGIFKEDLNSIKIIEWPELIESNVSNRLEFNLSYSNKENQRKLSLVGHGKWKDISKNEL